jgi:hypothetical protein
MGTSETELNPYGRLKLLARRADWNATIDFMAFQHERDGTTLYGEPLMLREYPDSYQTPRVPTFRLDYAAAQALMDELWTCGLRPSEGTGSAGALAATQKHLEDMRKLVFEFMERYENGHK